jgi:hypothetical protein
MSTLTLAERLADTRIDLTKAMIPPSLVDLGMEGNRQVVAAAFLPPRMGYLPAHLVVYYRGNDPDNLTPYVRHADKGWAVSLLVNNGDERVLTQGDYDLTFAEAMAIFVRRIERQG